MEIQCSNCNKKFKIPDEKIPNVSKFSVKCPVCGYKIRVERNLPTESKESSIDQALNLPSVEPEMHPPGSKVAFVFLKEKELFDKLKKILEELGYIISTASNTQEAVAKINLNRYNMIIISDAADTKMIFKEIELWPGNLRRYINVIALGNLAKTFDPNREFILGVNSYISTDDFENIDTLIKNAIKRHEDFLIPWKFAQKNE